MNLTEEHKTKISEALTGHAKTSEHRAAISRAMRGQVPPHGDRNRYKRLGCRCDRCRKAQSDYVRARRQARA
jgi:NUMOD3 motif